MWIRLLYIFIGFTGALLLIASSGRIWLLGNLYDLLYNIVMAVVSRIDRLLTGNDGNYSHTRFLNILWGVGNFALICVAVLRSLPIPSPILVLMGAGMGINMSGTVLNKVQEVKKMLTPEVKENDNG